ncbi:hypothetical protein [Wolbachia endosymbiont (group A) of Ennomos erosarius]
MLTNLIKFLDPSVKHWDDKKRSTGMTAVLRHTAAVSLDTANK